MNKPYIHHEITMNPAARWTPCPALQVLEPGPGTFPSWARSMAAKGANSPTQEDSRT